MLVTALVALALAGSATGAPRPTIAFGRGGGNILPFSATIDPAGHVHATGPSRTRASVTAPTIASILKLAARIRFSALPAQTNCPGTLPDLATNWIRIGAKTVRVHGGCIPGFAQLDNALFRAVVVGPA
jgi:hypothetical protein